MPLGRLHHLDLAVADVGFRLADGGTYRYHDVGIERFAFSVDAPEELNGVYDRCRELGAKVQFRLMDKP